MSKAYIPKDTWVVCTYQQNTDPKKLDVTRAKVSVFYKEKPLLTVEDRNTDKKFICKSPMNLIMGLVGLGVGLLLASNPIGWVVGGICVVALTAAATIVIVTHKCTGHLQAGKWINYKETVKFNGYRAITQDSMLMCDSGGVLQPIISYDVACKAAQSIAWQNRAETAVITIGAIASGFLMGKGGGFVNAMKGIFTKSGALFTLGGIGTTYAMISYQQHIMRDNEAYADNDIYQRMNEAEEKDYSDIKVIVNETVNTIKNATLSGTPPNIEDLAGVVQLYRTGQLIIQDRALQAKFEKLSSLNKLQLRKSPAAAALLKEIQASHPEVFDAIKKSPNSQPIRLRSNMRDKAISYIDNKISKNKWSLNNPNSLLSKGSGIALFFVPLVSGYFSENARRKLANIAKQDATDSITVRTSK